MALGEQAHGRLYLFGRRAYSPMEYITRQTQGDFTLDQRDDNLWMDAGAITTQADWFA
jgi:hypothetical protein